MQSDILAKHTSASVRVYAVWLPILAGDSRSQWHATFLPDRRAVHFWDENRIVGQWFAEKVEGHRGVVWDAYFLYGPEAKWEGMPAPLISSGSPVISRRNELERSMGPLLKRV